MGAKCCKGREKYPHLFEPIHIGNIRLKNRIIAAPTSPSMITTEGHFTPEMIAYLEEKAKGGAAVVTYGESIVHSATGKSHNKQLQLDSFGVKQMMAEAARAIHNAGAYANIQLSHGGKYGGLASVGGDQDCADVAYGVSDEDTPAGTVHAMSREMIFEIIDAYRTSARLCRDCGFDMVQVNSFYRGGLMPEIEKSATCYTGTRVLKIVPEGVLVEKDGKEFVVEADSVVCALGFRAPYDAVDALCDQADESYIIGDCANVGQIYHAINQAYYAAMWV